jgi:hypothetical protein
MNSLKVIKQRPCFISRVGRRGAMYRSSVFVSPVWRDTPAGYEGQSLAGYVSCLNHFFWSPRSATQCNPGRASLATDPVDEKFYWFPPHHHFGRVATTKKPAFTSDNILKPVLFTMLLNIF